MTPPRTVVDLHDVDAICAGEFHHDHLHFADDRHGRSAGRPPHSDQALLSV